MQGYRLAIAAYDQGEPSLETIETVVVIVQQVVTAAPSEGVGFKDLQNEIQVMENTPQEAVLKTLKLSNKPVRRITMQCKVLEARDADGNNAASLFRAELNNNQGWVQKKLTKNTAKLLISRK